MRLSSIKLCGFKSFAEPTQFGLPGQRVGVVGPNGCGKSNIIDAVRWVLGESRASELRGDSMQDVIFNGTTTRKPASRASVELVFDNSTHRAGGQWNAFEEIAVKRVLTREGTSGYYINNQAVRRRDVQDVFLGTGLGPRAYAIIGQGTISRIIESRPEEMRLFMEEAAGVSKYKERRRETENRIQGTEENLTRVGDILREVNANLEKLERQAELARQYQDLQGQVTTQQHQLWFLKHAESTSLQEKLASDVAQAVNALEQKTSELRRAEANLEAVRQQHYTAADALNTAQGQLYEASSEVGRIEAEIRFVVQGKAKAQARIEQIDSQRQAWQARAQEAQAQRAQIESIEQATAEQSITLAAQLEEVLDGLPEREEALREARHHSAQALQAATQVQQQIQVISAQRGNLQEQLEHLQARRLRLEAQQKTFVMPDEAALQRLGHECEVAQARLEEAQTALALAQDAQPLAAQHRQAMQEAANEESARLTDLQAKLDALEALQAQVLANDRLQPWLIRQGLLDPSDAGAPASPQLWHQVQVDKGWEVALEAALHARISARQTSRLETLAGFEQDPPPAKLAFFCEPAQGLQALSPLSPVSSVSPVNPLRPLISRIKTGEGSQNIALQATLNDWLFGCYTASSLAQALESRAILQAGEAIYTAQGHCVRATSLTFYAPEGEQAGLLARAQAIDNLILEVKAHSLIAAQARSALQQAQAEDAAAHAQLQAAQGQVRAAQLAAHERQMQHTQQLNQARELHTRMSTLQSDQAESEAQARELQEKCAVLEAQFEGLDLALSEAQSRHAMHDDAVLAAERRLSDWREQQRSLERQAQQSQFEARSLQAKREELDRTLALGQAQMAQINTERESLEGELQSLNDTAAQTGLQTALSLKVEREHQLSTARTQYDALTQSLRATDELRMRLERELEPHRARISELQLKEQAARLSAEQYMQFLSEANADLAHLQASMQAGVQAGTLKPLGLQAEINRLHDQITSLGAINLAALQELTTERERKGFLDAQSLDLTEALSTLQDAIKKIDAETRDLLGSTFAQVNEHFGHLFPKLFGGGEARLIMTGEEILDAGIAVMAQPPGKKNQTIHLLSGGEKALTAIALVFAIFQLNPAPFCLLDEVDAPLDDANTERYAKLVSSMSQGTQFLFISHNKIAMEMAQQLIGVTMQEQGVSRIVAVDMQGALCMTSDRASDMTSNTART